MATLRATFSSVRDRVEAVGASQKSERVKRIHLTPGKCDRATDCPQCCPVAIVTQLKGGEAFSPHVYGCGAEIVTYLPLQMVLYFNVFYSPLWVIVCIFTLENKYEALATHYKFVTITIYVVMFLVEAARLYLGYEGNLREKVPELAGFWLLTLLQFPLIVYLLANVNTIVLPLERAASIPLLGFLLFQLILGFRALQLMVKAQAIKFHLSQFDSIRPHREHIEMQEHRL